MNLVGRARVFLRKRIRCVLALVLFCSRVLQFGADSIVNLGLTNRSTYRREGSFSSAPSVAPLSKPRDGTSFSRAVHELPVWDSMEAGILCPGPCSQCVSLPVLHFRAVVSARDYASAASRTPSI
ncbi:hypothetical protein C8R45DRAFT_528935 [Mycena sanguinolenta]|nr:hypothetical protein C8R45DRAFT_528935 [Mycena sanguinolenta]